MSKDKLGFDISGPAGASVVIRGEHDAGGKPGEMMMRPLKTAL